MSRDIIHLQETVEHMLESRAALGTHFQLLAFQLKGFHFNVVAACTHHIHVNVRTYTRPRKFSGQAGITKQYVAHLSVALALECTGMRSSGTLCLAFKLTLRILTDFPDRGYGRTHTCIVIDVN